MPGFGLGREDAELIRVAVDQPVRSAHKDTSRQALSTFLVTGSPYGCGRSVDVAAATVGWPRVEQGVSCTGRTPWLRRVLGARPAYPRWRLDPPVRSGPADPACGPPVGDR